MTPVLRVLRPWLEPVVAAVSLTLWIFAETGRLHGVADLVVLILFTGALGIGRVLPRTALAVVMATLLLQLVGILPLLESTTWPVYLIGLGVVFVATRALTPPFHWVALALGLPVAALVAFLLVIPINGFYGWTSWIGAGTDASTVRNAFFLVAAVTLGLYAGAWAAAIAVTASVKQRIGSALLRRTATELGVAEVELLIGGERDRIAREVHDVLAHSLAVVIAQADGARFIAETKPEATQAALHAISDAARSALIDVRTFVEGLREESGDAPQPSLADLEPLLARLAGAGMQIGITHFGTARTLTPAQELAVFRIVQECLTNALRHAGATATTQITFDWRGPGLAFTVTSRDSTRRTHSAEPSAAADALGAAGTSRSLASMPGETARVGHGIRGMKDRARLVGGWLTAGRAEGPDDDFLVTVFIPVGAADDRSIASTETPRALRAGEATPDPVDLRAVSASAEEPISAGAAT